MLDTLVRNRIAVKIRLAQDGDGARIGALARASGFSLEGIDWTAGVYPNWLVAERDGAVVGAIQIILSKPIGWLEMLSLDPELSRRQKALAVKALILSGGAALRRFGAQMAMGCVPDEMTSYKRVLVKRGVVDTGSGFVMAMRL